MQDNYFAIFKLNHGSSKGKELAQLLALYSDDDIKKYTLNGRIIKGFHTKASMKKFVEAYSEGMRDMKLLKPIS